MKALVLYIIAVALGVLVTPYIASILHLDYGLPLIGVLLVVVYVIAAALSAIPWPRHVDD